MHCLQWLLPVLLLPKPVNPLLLYNHAVFLILYLFSFFIERKPCTICSLVFIIAVFFYCMSGNCIFGTRKTPATRNNRAKMKINESTLITYATSNSSPIDKEGWLWKQGEVNKSFQKRYCVLKGNLLFYFEKQHDKEPLGLIILEGSTIELDEEEHDMCGFKIVFQGEGRRIVSLRSDSHANIEEWIKILSSSSYDYMKLMVLELQQKLAEVEELEKQQELQQKSSGSLRTNPFHKNDPTVIAGNASSWIQLHTKFGSRISSDRDKWCQGLIS